MPLRDDHAVHEQLDRAGGETQRLDGVVAGEGVHLEAVGRLVMEDRHRRARPLSFTSPESPLASIASLPGVPLTTTRSTCPSPPVPPRLSARSTLTPLTSVPLRSVTLTRSAPPSAFTSTRSIPAVSMVTLPTSWKKRSRLPLADRVNCSAAGAPLKRIVSEPSWPSTTSLPSPGSHTNTSSPEPSRALSLPLVPSTTSLPSPPT